MTTQKQVPTGTKEITALARLITLAVQDIVSEYTKAGHSVPSLHSTEHGPFDAPHLISPRLAKAIQTVEAACAQLSFTVANPGHVITNKAFGHEEPACLLLVTNAKIADILLDEPGGLPVKELAARSGLDAGKLGRILRMLATKHCFKEVNTNVFANNRLSMQLVSKNPVSSFVGHITDEAFKASCYLSNTLMNPKMTTPPDDTPFRRAHGTSLFEFYGKQVAKFNERFGEAMIGWGEVTGKSMLPKVYAWDTVEEGATICDVGGGNGHVTLGLIKEFPKMKVVVQDLPAVIQQGKKYWTAENPEAVEQQRVQFVPIDFFTDSPVSGCDFYYLRHVLHDWPDAECSKILRNVRKAMKSNSRLLIHEFVLQHAVRDSDQTVRVEEQAPEPLLANYGMGRIRLYQQDINMMVLLNSKERTLQEFVVLGEKAGFKFERLWNSGEAGLIEFGVA